jgi:hypothetical protein
MASVSLYGKSTIRGSGDDYDTEYMTRIWLGRLRFHIFHRGDADPDCHDHPWDFWTFPLTSYVEEVLNPSIAAVVSTNDSSISCPTPTQITRNQVVRAFRPHYRPAEHAHRVLGRWSGEDPCGPRPIKDGKIYTLVWRSRDRLDGRWGFFVHSGFQWCKFHWKRYSKHAMCE